MIFSILDEKQNLQFWMFWMKFGQKMAN